MKDGDQIIDGNGNIFEYNTEHDTWVYKGRIESPDLVTRYNDGLVYPSLYKRMLLIQELIDKGMDFGLFKLDTPGDIPYYYFFYSSDDLIRFYPRPNGKLQIELDRNRLYQKLLRSCCAGPKGQVGLKGITGRDGIPAERERYFLPTHASDNQFEFETTVDTPIDADISLRLYRANTILVEYLIRISGGTSPIVVGGSESQNLTDQQKQASELEYEAHGDVQNNNIDAAIIKLESIVSLGIDVVRIQGIIDSLLTASVWPEESKPLTIIIYDNRIDISITNTEINFDHSTNKIWGTLSFTKGASDISSWRYKVRQRGPKGQAGRDGSPFLFVSNQILADTSIQSGSVISSLRKSDLTNSMFSLSYSLPTDVCVSNLALSASSLPVGDIMQAKFAAAKVTTRRCKDIGYYQYAPPEYTPPELELPSWEPTPDCLSAARYNAYKFEWWDLTDPKYPFRIVTPPRPNEQCCQEPFFWCPNVGDNPCGVNHWRCGELEKLPSGAANAQGLACDGEAKEPILKAPKPHPPECDCDCDSPITFELQNGGMQLDQMVVDESNRLQSSTQYSVVDGRTDTYKANIKSNGPVDITVQLDWKPELCGGSKERDNCQYQDNCSVHSTIIFEDNNKNAEISGGGASELSSIPGNVTFMVKPLSGVDVDIVINVMINDTRSQCCRGYSIRVTSQYKGTIETLTQQANVQVVDIGWGR
jgi:hypothetical protein